MATDLNRPVSTVMTEYDGRIATAEAQLTKPIVYFTSSTISVAEGNLGTKVMTVTARRSTLTGALNVPANYVAGTANAADFPNGLPGNKVLAFPDGSDTFSFDVSISGDTDVESDDTFGFQLQAGSSYRLGTASSVTGIIVNDDTAQASGAEFAVASASPTQNRVYQRVPASATAGVGGWGTIDDVSLTVTKAGAIYARTISAVDGSVVQAAFVAISNAAVASATIVPIPGIRVSRTPLIVQLSPNGSTGWIAVTPSVFMGMLIGVCGQSQLVRTFNRMDNEDTATIASKGLTIIPEGRIRLGGEAGGAGWITPSDSNSAADGAGAVEAFRLLCPLFGCAVGFVGHLSGGTVVENWIPTADGGTATPNFYQNLMDSLATAGGSFEYFWYYQGGSNNPANSAYKARLLKLLDVYVRGKTSIAPKFIVTNNSNYDAREQLAVDSSISGLDRTNVQGQDVATALGGTYLDFRDTTITVTDYVHPTQDGSIQQMRHFYRAVKGTLGQPGYEGPTLGTPVRDADGVTINIPAILPSGATALAVFGNTGHRWTVHLQGSVTEANKLALDATTPVTISGTTIKLKLAANPGDVPLEVRWASAQNIASGDGYADFIYDNRIDGDGIPRGRPLLPSRVPVRTRVASPLTGTSVTYAAGKFGQGLSANAFARVSNVQPMSIYGLAVSCWVTHTSLPSGSQVLFGNVLPTGPGYYVAINGTTIKWQWGGGERTVECGFVVGGSNHVVMQIERGGSQKLFVDGVLKDQTDTTAPPEVLGVFGIKVFGSNGSQYTSGVVSDFAIFAGNKFNSAGFTPPTARWTANEPGLFKLWPLNGTLEEVVPS